MRVIVYEHVSSGGYAGQPLPIGVLAEGFGMLRTVASDFKAAGHEVTVLLDERISKLNPPMNVDCIVPILNQNEPKNFLVEIARINDAAHIIAPETGQTLQSLVQIMEQTGKISLNCKPSAIQTVADKSLLYKILKQNGVPTPETALFNVDDALGEITRFINNKFSYPVVFKPFDGVSCAGLSLVRGESQIAKALARIRSESTQKQFLISRIHWGRSCKRQFTCGRRQSISHKP